MNTDRVEGAARKAAGATKEAVGKAVGSTKMTAKGKAEKAAGAVQNKVGKMEDRAR